MIDPLLPNAARWFLALLFIAAGVHKAVNRAQFRASVSAYAIVPPSLASMTADLLISAEIAVGLALLASPAGEPLEVWSRFGAALILAIYFFAMAFNIHRGHTNVDCGCSLLRTPALLSRWHLVRSACLMGLTALLWLPTTGRPLDLIDAVQVAAAVVCFTLLHLCADALIANRSHVLRRMS